MVTYHYNVERKFADISYTHDQRMHALKSDSAAPFTSSSPTYHLSTADAGPGHDTNQNKHVPIEDDVHVSDFESDEFDQEADLEKPLCPVHDCTCGKLTATPRPTTPAPDRTYTPSSSVGFTKQRMSKNKNELVSSYYTALTTNCLAIAYTNPFPPEL